MENQSTSPDPKRIFSTNFWRNIAKATFFFLCTFNILSSQSKEALWIDLPLDNIVTTGQYSFSLFDIAAGKYQDNNEFFLDKPCDPCQFKLSFDNKFLSKRYKPIIFEGFSSVIITTGNLNIVDTLKSRNSSAFVFRIPNVERSSTYSIDAYASMGDKVSIYSMHDHEFEEISYLENKQSLETERLISYGFLGLLLMVTVLNMIRFLLTDRKAYLYYSLYALGVLFYFGAAYIPQFIQEYNEHNKVLFDKLRIDIRRIIQPLFYAFYHSFVIHFLETRKKYSGAHKVFCGLVVISYAAFLITSVFLLFNLSEVIIEDIYIYYRLLMAITSLLIILYMFRHYRDPYVLFMVIGGSFLLIGSLMAWIFTVQTKMFLGIAPVQWMIIGTILELIMFSAGLSFKTYKIEEERNAYKDSLIIEMKATDKLRSQQSEILKKEIDKATNQTQFETEQKLSAQYELKVQKLEIEALHAQMNPHFLFNSMSNLKSYILQEKTNEASHYLDDLAKLFRSTLSNLKRTRVTLKDEIEFLMNYVTLENKRLDDKIDFVLEIPEENCIWHGLSNSTKTDKKIWLNIITGDHISIKITDNGTGVKKNGDKFLGSTGREHSTEINRKRLKIIYGENADLKRTTLIENGQISGTEVIITLPLT